MAAVAACTVFVCVPSRTADARSAKSADKPGKDRNIMICAYKSGNCNGMPYASMTSMRGYLAVYDNGNCNGMPFWSMKKSSRC